jgi:hypothetical protein
LCVFLLCYFLNPPLGAREKKRNSHVRAEVKADTPTVTVTKGSEQHSAPWVVESPGGTVTTSAYNGGEKRCLSAEGGLAIRGRRFLNKTKPSRRLISKTAVASA